MADVIQQLRDYMAANPLFAIAFEASFELAKTFNIPQFAEWNINTLDDFINFYQTMLTWMPSENMAGTNVYYHLCMFYFVIDLEPVKSYQTPILPSSTPPWSWLSQWLVSYSVELGKFMDTDGSIDAATLATFYSCPAYHMSDYPVPPGGWKTFNEFFARHIKSNVRPITDPNDPTVIVSPADSHFDGSWAIDNNADVTTFDVKHLPWSITQLLQDSNYGEKFKGGKFMHSFLAPSDYHRQHAPVAGTVVEAKVIPGLCYLQVIAEPDSNGGTKLNMKRELRLGSTTEEFDAPDDPGYQFLQARGLVVLDSAIGYVAVLPIGMCQISSVMLSVKEGDELAKGDEISYFQFGGSDIVVVFEEACNVNFTAQNQHYNFGTQIATAQVVTK